MLTAWPATVSIVVLNSVDSVVGHPPMCGGIEARVKGLHGYGQVLLT